VSEIMRALYAGDRDRAQELAGSAELDVFESAALGETERLRELLGTDSELPRARSVDDFTALHYAAFFGSPDAARLLVDRGADVNAYADNALGVHVLNSAVASGQRETVEILLDAGADANAPTRSGHSPLNVAVANGDEEIADLLRSRGAVN
jgi:uncharacterized protein